MIRIFDNNSHFIRLQNILCTNKICEEKKLYFISCTTRRNSSGDGFKHVRSSKDVEPRLFRIAALVVLPKLIN